MSLTSYDHIYAPFSTYTALLYPLHFFPSFLCYSPSFTPITSRPPPLTLSSIPSFSILHPFLSFISFTIPFINSFHPFIHSHSPPSIHSFILHLLFLLSLLDHHLYPFHPLLFSLPLSTYTSPSPLHPTSLLLMISSSFLSTTSLSFHPPPRSSSPCSFQSPLITPSHILPSVHRLLSVPFRLLFRPLSSLQSCHSFPDI